MHFLQQSAAFAEFHQKGEFKKFARRSFGVHIAPWPIFRAVLVRSRCPLRCPSLTAFPLSLIIFSNSGNSSTPAASKLSDSAVGSPYFGTSSTNPFPRNQSSQGRRCLSVLGDVALRINRTVACGQARGVSIEARRSGNTGPRRVLDHTAERDGRLFLVRHIHSPERPSQFPPLSRLARNAGSCPR